METIYLEPDEEITEVVEKLFKAEGKKIKFVVPKGATLLQSLVNLKLLKKKADDLKREILIVTTDKIGRNLASQVGISVVSESGEGVLAKSKVRELEEIPTVPGVRVHRYYLPREEEIKEEEREVAPAKATTQSSDETAIQEKVSQKVESREIKLEKVSPVGGASLSRKRKIILSILVSLFLLAGSAFVYIFGPRAEAIVYVQGEAYPLTLTIEASTSESNFDLENGKMPLMSVVRDVTFSKEFPATGKKDVGEKAKGSITVYNSWDQNPQTLVAGTRFVAEGSGKVFKSVSDVTVPGATLSLTEGQIVVNPSSATVAVEAEEPGDSYNIGASKFTIAGLSPEKQKKIYGVSTSAMTGGTSKQVTVVSEKDLADAKKSVTEEAIAKAREEAKSSTKEAILEGVEESEVTSVQFSAKSGEEKKSFTAEVNVKEHLLSFDRAKFEEFIKELVQKKAPEGKNIVLTSEITGITPKVEEASIKDGSAKLSLSLETTVYVKIDKERIQTLLVGKTQSKAREALESQRASRIEVRLTPGFLKRLPWRKEQIKVIVKTL